MSIDANKGKLDRLLKDKVERLYKDEANEAKRTLSILDTEFVKERFQNFIGGRLQNDGKTSK